MKRNLLKCILWVLLLAGCFPLLAVAGAQQKEQRYKIAVCDWMILKRQKIGSFQLVHELKGDGVDVYKRQQKRNHRLSPIDEAGHWCPTIRNGCYRGSVGALPRRYWQEAALY